VLDPELSTRLLRERFIREVEVASKLTHPHIVPIFAAGGGGSLLYHAVHRGRVTVPSAAARPTTRR
jgi:hypothetical protein